MKRNTHLGHAMLGHSMGVTVVASSVAAKNTRDERLYTFWATRRSGTESSESESIALNFQSLGVRKLRDTDRRTGLIEKHVKTVLSLQIKHNLKFLPRVCSCSRGVLWPRPQGLLNYHDSQAKARGCINILV